MTPPIRYVRNADGLNIAYYTLGDARPLIVMPPVLSHSMEAEWEISVTRQIAELSSRNFKYIRFDPHGCGLSDRDDSDLSLESFVHDLEAVADAAATEPFALFAPGAMSTVAMAYAARRPERLTHLVLWMAFAQGSSLDNPLHNAMLELALVDWRAAMESMARAYDNWTNDELTTQMVGATRDSVAPATFVKFERARRTWDVTENLGQIRTPTLIMHPRNHKYFGTEEARRIAGAIPGARLTLLESATALFPDASIALPIGQFLGVGAATPTGRHRAPRGTAIILFADIAGSTQLTERLGDAAFRDRSRALDAALRSAIRAGGGKPVEGKVMGDGVMAVFDSARQAIDAALRCREASAHHELGLHLGIHAGDVIREEANVYGGAVNIAARIADACAPGEILVSDVVRALARTSAGVSFDDRGEHALKGIDEPQRLWAIGVAAP